MSLQSQYRPLNPRLGTHYAIIVSAFTALVIVLALLEQLGARKLWLSHTMIVAPLFIYLIVAVLTRTLEMHEFFSAARRIPPVFGGLALAVTAIGCQAVLTLFTMVTLPVEFDASKRALAWVEQRGIVNQNEHGMAKDALKWAAMTYLVAAIGSLVTLFYFIMMFLGGRD